jgi:hypothetical protein
MAGDAKKLQPIIVKKVKKGGRRRPWRRLEDRLRRLRHRHDGLLPADVAAGLHHEGQAGRHRRLLQDPHEGGHDRRFGCRGRHQPDPGGRHGPHPGRPGQEGRSANRNLNLAAQGRSGAGRNPPAWSNLKQKLEEVIASNVQDGRSSSGQLKLD